MRKTNCETAVNDDSNLKRPQESPVLLPGTPELHPSSQALKTNHVPLTLGASCYAEAKTSSIISVEAAQPSMLQISYEVGVERSAMTRITTTTTMTWTTAWRVRRQKQNVVFHTVISQVPFLTHVARTECCERIASVRPNFLQRILLDRFFIQKS